MDRGGRHNPKFRNRLRKFRLTFGYTQEEVAWMLNLGSRTRLSKWEKGKSLPSVENLLLLCRLYRTLPPELFPGLYKKLSETLSRREEQLALRKHNEKAKKD